jgi:hypothetical protein
MIISRLIGGLGNQMFQYAAGKSLAIKLDADLKLDVKSFKEYPLRIFELDCFKLNYRLATKDELKIYSVFNQLPLRKLNSIIRKKIFKFLTKKTYFKEPYCEVAKDFFNLSGDVYLDGYWNSEQYFKSIELLIRKDFQFPRVGKTSIRSYLNLIKKSQAVSLHIRRGDYAHSPKTKAFHGLCSIEYYQRAMQAIESKVKKPVYFIFSDDKAWAKKHIRSNNKIIYIDHKELDFEDMRLMSKCRHHIIANSTFSWWGAWLNKNSQKMVIAPKRWFLAKHMIDKDICPKNWVRL